MFCVQRGCRLEWGLTALTWVLHGRTPAGRPPWTHSPPPTGVRGVGAPGVLNLNGAWDKCAARGHINRGRVSWMREGTVCGF